MNYFLLAETDFFRLINEAGDCNMETAYTAFATQVIELCNGGMDMTLPSSRLPTSKSSCSTIPYVICQKKKERLPPTSARLCLS